MHRVALVLAASALLAATARAETPARPAVELSAGVADFNRDLSSLLGVGPAWGLRARVGLGDALSLVIGYQGAATRIVADGVAGNPLLLSNGGFAAFELGGGASWSVRPYAFVGAGLLRSTAPAAAQGLLRSDTAGIVPAGFGLEGGLSEHLVLGGRFTYDLVFDNELRPDAGSLAADLWSAALTLAWRF